MAVDELLKDGRINSMRLPHRILTGPMQRGLANRDGSLIARYVDYLTERARGGDGLIRVESTYVDSRGMGHLYQVDCHGDHMIPALERMAQDVHSEGAKVALELYLGGRQTPSSMSQRQLVAASAMECRKLNPVPIPRPMRTGDIHEIIEKFTQAARRVQEAGLDVIHLHGAHGYPFGFFWSPISNRRTNQYGGSLEKGPRFPLEVLSAVRQVVGPNFPIGYRLSTEEYVDGGLSLDDTLRFAQMLADGGIDLIDVSGGIYESGHMIIQGPEAPKGGFVRNAATIKRMVGSRVAVSVAQRLNGPDFANEFLLREKLDFISLTRAFHARIRTMCANSGSGKRRNFFPALRVTSATVCSRRMCPPVAPRIHKLHLSVSTLIKRRRSHDSSWWQAVGRPECTRRAFSRWKDAESVSMKPAVVWGGQMGYSALVAPDYAYLVDYLRRQLAILQVDCHFNAPVNIELLAALSPDVMVVPTGAAPALQFFPAAGTANQLNLFSCLDRKDSDWGGRTIIASGDSASSFTGLYCAQHEEEVHIVELGTDFCSDKLLPAKDLLLSQLKTMPAVCLRFAMIVEETGRDYVIIQNGTEFERMEDVRRVVVDGRTANNQLYEAIRYELPTIEAHNIGDSVRSKDVYAASHEAAETAVAIRLRAATSLVNKRPGGDLAELDRNTALYGGR